MGPAGPLGDALGLGGDSGGGSTSASDAAGQAALQQIALATGLIGQVDPLRQNLLNRGLQFLGVGGTVPSALSGGQPAQAALPGGVAPNSVGIPAPSTPLATRSGASTPGVSMNGKPDMSSLGDLNTSLQSIPLDAQGMPIPQGSVTQEQPADVAAGKPDQGANLEPGGFDVTASPLFDPIFGAAQDQFNIANESVLSTLPQGGALQEAIAENARRRAQTITGASADIAQQELANIMTLITGGTQQGISGAGMGTSALTGLAGQQAQAQATQDAGKNQMLGGMGSALPFLFL